MTKLLVLLFVSFFPINFLLGEDLCNGYNNQNCFHPKTLKNGYFVNIWSVLLPGVPKEEAKQYLENIGFIYLGQVTFIIYHINQI